jgi:hypothetical protein
MPEVQNTRAEKAFLKDPTTAKECKILPKVLQVSSDIDSLMISAIVEE